ncbi:HNH endonuclease [Desulfotomaculum copahuensis]|uniref:HNH endonuclease signature motif containing protein n=1 Tax=Desulfotomaculum copahuensis TaxID=1838280 RepID=UPI00098FB878
MPIKPPSPCRWPGCPDAQAPGCQGYCREHVKAHRQQDAAHRGTARQRGYNASYEKARAWVLKHHPLCVVCKMEGRLSAATVTHHVVHLADGGSNSASNLLPVCGNCHDRLHSKAGPEIILKLRN